MQQLSSPHRHIGRCGEAVGVEARNEMGQGPSCTPASGRVRSVPIHGPIRGVYPVSEIKWVRPLSVQRASQAGRQAGRLSVYIRSSVAQCSPEARQTAERAMRASRAAGRGCWWRIGLDWETYMKTCGGGQLSGVRLTFLFKISRSVTLGRCNYGMNHVQDCLDRRKRMWHDRWKYASRSSTTGLT